MRLTFRNIGSGTKSRTGDPGQTPVKYWDEEDRRARYNAVSDACWIYQHLEVEQNLRRFGWRQACRRVLAQGALSREWMNRGYQPSEFGSQSRRHARPSAGAVGESVSPMRWSPGYHKRRIP
jgi:hypothetical protein